MGFAVCGLWLLLFVMFLGFDVGCLRLLVCVLLLECVCYDVVY